ncbi:OMEGA-stichotoxin-Shd4a-like [Cyclopterus lumpus]|uniref:EGF-like domain-containing protein n=1 Tax=Cyclopterus lumpus TaxID=8103 RepID=A0A8C2WNS8_CYCLU|nr:OMEGA-stichotoxin-Shd4a-like [Cyclopterus lumpus]
MTHLCNLLQLQKLRFHKLETAKEMMAEHGVLCDGQEATYCMNGGTCYNILSMNTLSCVCNENFRGSRCEQFQLSSYNTKTTEAGLIAAVVIVVLLILMMLAVVIYYIRRMLKAKQQSQQNNQPEYWRVKPRV